MKIVKNNYHTHLKLCNHAFGMPEDYIKEAIRLGMEGIGISDHNPVPAFLYPEAYLNVLPNNMKLEEFYDVYIPSIEECINKYGNDYQLEKAVAEECIYRVESGLYSTKRYSNELEIN